MCGDPFPRRLVRVEASLDAAPLAGDVLWQSGATAIEEQDGPCGVVLVAGYIAAAAATAAAGALTAAGHCSVSVLAVTDDGRNGWRPWARVERAGRFVLLPPWVEGPRGTDRVTGEVVLTLDPGPTFGSGSHPTTRLVLAALDRLVGPGCSVLDVGCGSGVLSVAAAVLGASPVVAIDIDPAAPAVTSANATRNDVGAAVDVSNRSLAEVVATGRRFDVVAANLLAPVFVDLGAELVAALRPDGHLVASGLLADRWSDTVGNLDALVVEDVDDQDGWAAITLRAPAPA